MALSAVALLAALAALIGALVWSQAMSQRFFARADMAHRQALLVTRLEADLAARGLAQGAERTALDTQIRTGVQAYLATIATERGLIDDDGDSQARQHEEWNAARRLASLTAAPQTAALFARSGALSHAIALREKQEAQQAADAMNRIQQQIWAVIGGVALVIAGLCLAMGLLLWRGIVRPVGALVDGANRLAAEQGPVRVPPTGLGEMQRLIHRFNAMADAVEEQVRQRTRELERAYRDLKAVDGRRRLFLSKVSHELRTPVTVMRGEAEVALRGPADRESLSEALSHIHDNGIFLQRRLDDLLALALAEDGALGLAQEPFDLAEALHAAHALARPFARSSGIDLRLDAAGGELPVLGDRERIRQALGAVIDNGVKFSPPGGAITVHLERQPGSARIEIMDEGPGVADGDLDQIFDPYVQTGAGRSRGGTGLGLSLARWISYRHGGSVTASNRHHGEGLCVAFTFPLLS